MKLNIPKITQITLEQIETYDGYYDGQAYGDVQSNRFNIDLDIELIWSYGCNWHVDVDVTTNPISPILIISNPGESYRVEAGKRQHLPTDQPPGTLFALNVHKRHRLVNHEKVTDPWVALSDITETMDATEFGEYILKLESSL